MDIHTYIDRRLIIDNQYLKKDLAEVISRKARGIFMWVVLVMSLLNDEDRCGNAHSIYKRLDHMPAELSELIEELLKRGPRNPYFRPLLKLMTFAVTYSHLSPRSIYSALTIGVSVNGNERTEIKPSSSEARTHEKFILDASKGLFEIVGNPAKVQYIHESVRTFFMNDGLKYLTSDGDMEAKYFFEGEPSDSETCTFEILSTRCHYDLMQFCIRYVVAAAEIGVATQGHMYTYQCRRLFYGNTEHEPLPFLLYVQDCFWKHVEGAWKGRSRQTVCLESIPAKVLDLLTHTLYPWNNGEAHLKREPFFKIAYLLTAEDSSTLLSVVLEAMSISGLQQRDLHYLMSLGVECDSVSCTSLLLQAGADPNAKTEKEVSLLSHALRKRRSGIVEQLLEAGARPYGVSDGEADSLHDECAKGDLQVMKLLLGKHLKAETDCQAYKNSLACALGKSISSGNKKLSMFLAEKGTEAGLWSYTVVDDEASDVVTMEFGMEDVAIAAKIQGQTPAVRRSLHDKTKLLMRLERRGWELETDYRLTHLGYN